MTGRLLPDAVRQNPACGACGNQTDDDGDGFFCDDCGLAFDTDLRASFFYPDQPPCGNGCDNSWHGDHRIKRGQGYDCGTCRLPQGHRSLCWTLCRPKAVEVER